MDLKTWKNDLKRLLDNLEANNCREQDEQNAVDSLKRLYTQLGGHLLDGVGLIPFLIRFLCYDDVESYALAILILLKSVQSPDYDKTFADALEDLMEIDSKPHLLKILAHSFTIAPTICHQLFLQNKTLIGYITADITDIINGSAQDSKYLDLLNLFSAACIDELCRAPIADQYMVALIRALERPNLRVSSTAALVVLKVWNNVKKETFNDHKTLSLSDLETVLTKALDENIANGIEGLAFLSLNYRSMRDNHQLISKLMTHLESDPYGVVSVLANLTNIPKKDQVSQLKNMHKKPDDEAQLVRFIEYLVDSQKIGKITGLKSVSTRVQEKVIELIYNISTVKQARPKLAQQGGYHTVITFLVNSSQNIDYKDKLHIKKPIDNPALRLMAINTLANILVSSNPNALFTKSEIVTPVPFLLEPVIQYDIELNGTKTESPLSQVEIDPPELFNALIALINISSVDGMDVKLLTVKLGWPAIGNLMLSANVQIRRSVLELLANLIMTPLCMEKFFNWSSEKDENFKNFQTLIRLMDLEDGQSQLAVLNILANSSDFDLIATMLSTSNLFIDHLFELIANTDDSDKLLRGFYILQNLANLPDHQLVAEAATKYKLKAVVANIFRTVGDLEVRHMAIDSLKKLQP
ncbi:hypothetical protein OGAPHI_001909 [Ogataea philodendri]|uniref:UNC-45/Cro1/She4 central domain-containing protein n=1 Tax=Ogataea philodendri TaxID=1378263 RepID=A0A9P8PAT2_9ASCO|nr:uncharacterized protein OGAPHI_001909 [Ogataea philodendri]KAH3668155.1 hypothetical protein OGAPHI_001909 [Ogataea philodendri]